MTAPVENTPPPSDNSNPLAPLSAMIEKIAERSRRPIAGAALDVLRAFLIWAMTTPPSGDGPAELRTPLELLAAFSSARALSPRLDNGAVLEKRPEGGYRLIRPDGSELARANRVAELGFLLSLIDGRPARRKGITVKLGSLARPVVDVLHTGESMGSVVLTAVRELVDRRQREFDAEMVAMDEADAVGEVVAHA